MKNKNLEWKVISVVRLSFCIIVVIFLFFKILGFKMRAVIVSGILQHIITGYTYYGMRLYNSTSALIKENTISGIVVKGIELTANSTANILFNEITTSGTDIVVSSDSTPHISFNKYDTISGDSGVGSYNVKSDGTPAPLQ